MLNTLMRKVKQGVTSRHGHAVTLDPGASSSLPIAAPVIGILGAKGGVGTSTLAVNLAIAFASSHRSTTLIDAHLQQPDIAHLVGSQPVHSLFDLLDAKGELDEKYLSACCVPVPSNEPRFNLLSPPLSGLAGIKFTLTDLAERLEKLRSFSALWLIDLPAHLDKHLVTVMDKCDRLILVFEATVSGVATCQRWLSLLAELGYENDRIICVLNRSGSKHSGVEQQLNTALPDRRIFRIPNASTINWNSNTYGIPAALQYPKHPYTTTVFKLAQHISNSLAGGANGV